MKISQSLDDHTEERSFDIEPDNDHTEESSFAIDPDNDYTDECAFAIEPDNDPTEESSFAIEPDDEELPLLSQLMSLPTNALSHIEPDPTEKSPFAIEMIRILPKIEPDNNPTEKSSVAIEPDNDPTEENLSLLSRIVRLYQTPRRMTNYFSPGKTNTNL